jgi:SpoVK/Ycf46/Vps4 family AAA+-type ATPase
MSIDLSGDLRKSLRKKLEEAKRLYKEGEDEKAAAAFETASRLLMMLADKYSPNRQTEIAQKKDAMKYREFAKRLRAGEIPVKAERRPERDAAPSARETGKAAIAPEISSAVSQLIHTSAVTWDEIGGLEETKREIKYALGLSLAKPPPSVKISSWRNMLFYGPPGTGKTLLAAATSNALKTTQVGKAVFFNVKVSSILSKYFGESTKIISELYGTARDSSPAVIFLDEFESLCGERDSEDTGPERRILSTILSELDGLAEKGREDIYVLTVAATNRPWDLDRAVLSRFEKKILIPLPDAISRRAILEIHLKRRGFRTAVDYDRLAEITDGYSGREIERFCKEVTNRMIAEMNENIPALVDKGLDVVKKYQVKVRDLQTADFDRARALVHAQTTPDEMQRYVNWKESITEM